MLQPEVSAKEQSIVPFFRLAFRPFFLLPSLCSIVLIIGWLAVLYGKVNWQAVVAPHFWHGHEMIFGFAAAVVVGFLLTAAQTWTGVRSMRSWPLALCVLLWLVARIGLVMNVGFAIASQALWWVISIGYLAFMVIKAGNYRNLIFIPLLTLLMLMDLVSLQAATSGNIAFASHLTYGAVLMISMVVTIVGGRVVPFFTYRALGLDAIKVSLVIERLVAIAMLLSMIIFIVSDYVQFPYLIAIVFSLTGVLQIIRMVNWCTLKTVKTPLLWSLHLAYLNMGLGFMAIALSEVSSVISFSTAVHIITIGTIGTMIIAMMSRVSLGHTGRPLQVNSWVSMSFLLLLAATWCRVLLPALGWLNLGYLLAGVCWCLGFAIYLFRYLPILVTARPDGHSG